MNIITKLTLATILINSFTPLRPAMDQSNEKLTAEQLQEKAVQKALNNALEKAIDANDLKKAQAALDDGADPDAIYPDASYPETASLFSHATAFSSVPMVELLINAGAQLNLLVKNAKFTSLGTAVKTTHSETVTLLINAGADVNAAKNLGKQTVLMFAAYDGSFNSKHITAATTNDIIYTLLCAGADYTVKDSHGYTANAYAKCVDIEGQTPFEQVLQKYQQYLELRTQRTANKLVPNATLQHAHDYLLNKPLSITPLCTIFTEYADHDRPCTVAEAAQRAAEAEIRQKWIKEAAAQRRAEARLAAHAAEIAQQEQSGKQ